MRVPLLGQLLDTLGPSPLHLVTAPAGPGIPVSGVLIYEPRASLRTVQHAMLLGVGLRPASTEAADLVPQAARAGHAALVIKEFGEPVTDLAAAAEDAGIALLAADEDMAWHHLDALVSAALAAIACSAPGSRAPALGDLFALANAIAGLAGGATAIEDPNRRILAYSTVPGQPIDEDRRQGILGLRVPDNPVNDAQYRELARTTAVCRFTAGPGSIPRLAVAVRAGTDLLGSIWVVNPDGALGPDADQALTEAADLAALHLLAARADADLARRQRGDLLRRLLADPASAVLVAQQLGLRAEAPVAVAAFVIVSGDPDGVLAAHTAIRFTDLVSLHCEAHYGRHACALIDGTVYALLPAHPAGRSHRDLVADVARRAQQALRVPVRAGLGAQPAGLRSAVSSRQDADLVLRVLAGRPDAADGPGEPDGPLVAAIEDVRASATLAELAEALSGVPRLRDGAGPAIRSHDAEHGTAYASTLLAYLDAGGDVAAAAQQLGVHPNTCRYRLARAEQIFGFSFAQPDERLLLWLQLRLGDQLGPLGSEVRGTSAC
ncbi:MAG: PucR family transcriptional regulator [Streptosporangiaceae bacterium]